MKYKLLKDLPLAKAGTEVYLERNSTTTSKIHAKGVYDLGSIVDTTIPEWLEEVKDPKTIYDLEIGDEYWDSYKGLKIFGGNWFPNANFSCFLTEREAKRNKLLRELATRTDKWLPEKNDAYVSYFRSGITNWTFSLDYTDMVRYHQGLVFRNEEEYNKYMTEEAKDLLFNI